ncbi:MAG: ATP-binding cassette domain-containing protein, partial [Oscillospiraceae bacterium]
TPKSGEIIWESGKIRPGEIGYLPQQTSVRRDFPASVSEVVLSGCAGRRGLRPFYNAADHARADRALESLDAQPLKKRPFSQLSGGQRQRVLLARALCAADGVLLLDEPVAALDPAASAEMYALIERLNRERGVTVLMVSHDLDAARRWARHVLAMKTESLYFGEAARYFEELSQPRGGNADA